MTRQIKRFYIDGLQSEITAISLVDYPAVEVDAIALAREKRPIRLESDEKRIMTGVVLRPDFPIYRNDEETGYEYEIVFSKDAVSQLEQKYMKELRGGNWTTDHKEYADGLYTIESWIKTDMQMDKSIALGLPADLPVGTWLASVKIEDDAVWQRVKRNDFGGFSIEAFCRMSEFELNKQVNNMDKKETFFEKLKNIFTEVFETEEQVVEQHEEALKEEVKVEETPVEEEVEEALDKVEETVEQNASEDTTEEIEAQTNLEEQSQIETLNAKVSELEAKMAELINKNAELQAANEKLAAQPSAKPINAKSEKKADAMDIVRQLHEGTYFK